MCIHKAKYNGKTVKSDLGEALRDKPLTCYMCRAKVHIHRYPNADDYYFALNPGEKHTLACRFFEATGHDIPELMETVADFVYRLMKRDKNLEEEHSNPSSHKEHDEAESASKKRSKKLTGITGIIKGGFYYEDPFDIALEEQNIRFIDLVIFDKWFNLVWKNSLVNIGPRVVDTRWIGSFNLHPACIKEIEDRIENKKEIWFKSFRKAPDGKYKSVMFCLDIRTCYSGIIQKLFRKGERKNKSFTRFSPNKILAGEPLDLLIASDWHPMPTSDCQKDCPLHKCDGCLGAYWGRCNSTKQVEIFTANQDFKNKHV